MFFIVQQPCSKDVLMSGDHEQEPADGVHANDSLDDSQHDHTLANMPATTGATEAPALSWRSPQNPGAPRTPEELASSLYGRAPPLAAESHTGVAPRSSGALHGFLDGIRTHWLTIVN